MRLGDEHDGALEHDLAVHRDRGARIPADVALDVDLEPAVVAARERPERAVPACRTRAVDLDRHPRGKLRAERRRDDGPECRAGGEDAQQWVADADPVADGRDDLGTGREPIEEEQGSWLDDAVEILRARAPANLELTGWLEDEALHDLLARASVYVQASRHEGFGMAVAEAMLAGAVPVVVDATAMPEVVGDAGVVVPSAEIDDVVSGIRRALALPASARERARNRVLERFPLERRREALLALCERALSGR